LASYKYRHEPDGPQSTIKGISDTILPLKRGLSQFELRIARNDVVKLMAHAVLALGLRGFAAPAPFRVAR